MNIQEVRSKFPIFQQPTGKRVAFLDSAASAQKPEVVLKAMDEFSRSSYANIHRGVYKLAEAASEAYEQARETVARFIGAKESAEVIFTKNATSALNTIAFGLGQKLDKGDVVVLTELEHHANLVPWQEAAARHGFILRFIPVTTDGRLDITKLDKVITKNVKVVSVTGMSNVTGAITDLSPIIKKAKSIGAVIVVDAAQLAPHKQIDVQSLDCDFLVFSGHKVFGPTGIGVLYGKRAVLEDLPPFEFGGGMIREVSLEKSSFAELPDRFEAGTPPILEAVGLAAALEFINNIGWQAVEEYERSLTRYGLEKFKEVPGFSLLGPKSADGRGPVFAFTVEGIHPHDLASVLDEHDVAVRAGHHCAMPLHKKFDITATTRASMAIYNTTDDIDRLVKGIYAAKKLLG